MKILIVTNDDKTRSELLNLLAGYQDHQGVAADSGQAALKLLETGDIEMIISDLDMAVMDGIQLLETVKATAETRGIPFLLLGSKGDQQAMNQAMRLGAESFIAKPVHTDHLRDEIERAGITLSLADD